jgi:hypothetical protein
LFLHLISSLGLSEINFPKTKPYHLHPQRGMRTDRSSYMRIISTLALAFDIYQGMREIVFLGRVAPKCAST